MWKKLNESWLSWVLAGLVLVAAPVVVWVVLVRGDDWRPWVAPAAVSLVLVSVGARLQHPANARPEERGRDRLLAWQWHHPVRATIAGGLLWGGGFALYNAVPADPRRYWWTLPLYVAAAFLGTWLGRFLPWSYEGDDPAVPRRQRRVAPASPREPGRRSDPRDPWV